MQVRPILYFHFLKKKEVLREKRLFLRRKERGQTTKNNISKINKEEYLDETDLFSL